MSYKKNIDELCDKYTEEYVLGVIEKTQQQLSKLDIETKQGALAAVAILRSVEAGTSIEIKGVSDECDPRSSRVYYLNRCWWSIHYYVDDAIKMVMSGFLEEKPKSTTVSNGECNEPHSCGKIY